MAEDTAGALVRRLPESYDAELAVIGSVFLNPAVLDEIEGVICAADFFHDPHSVWFEIVSGLYRDGLAVDPVTFRPLAQAAECWDAAHLGKCTASVPNAAHALHYSRIVAEHSQARALLDASAEIATQVYRAEPGTIGEVVEAAEASVLAVSEISQRAALTVRDAMGWVNEAMTAIEARVAGTAELGIPTGWPDLDAILGGLTGGQLVIVGGRPGQGKTSFASCLIENVVLRESCGDGAALYVSLEMSAAEVGERFLSLRSGVPITALRRGSMTAEQRGQVITAAGELAESRLAVFDPGSSTVSQVAAVSRRQQRSRGGLSLLVVDYLQLLTPEAKRSDNREQEVAKMSRRLKNLARSLGVPVVVLSQLNRASVSSGEVPREPRLSDLRESGAIEQDADVCLFVHRPDEYRADENAEGDDLLVVAKQRNGPTGRVAMTFVGELAAWRSRAASHYDEAEGGFSDD